MPLHNSRGARRIGLSLAACLLAAGPGCNRSKSASSTSPSSPSAASSPAPPGAAGGSSGAAASAADLQAGKLAGLYVRQQFVPFAFNGRMTFNLSRDFFYFFPDGHILFGVPEAGLKEHPTAGDFAAYQAVEAGKRGTYAVAGGQITIRHDNGDSTTEPFSVPTPGDDSVLQIGPPSVVGSVKAMPFPDGQKLDAAYQFDGTVGQLTALTIFNVNTLTFRPDGTLGSDQLSGVDSTGNPNVPGSTGVTTGGVSSSAGTYHLGGYTLQTNVGGKAQTATVFRWAGDDSTSAPGILCIAGRVYSRVGGKK